MTTATCTVARLGQPGPWGRVVGHDRTLNLLLSAQTGLTMLARVVVHIRVGATAPAKLFDTCWPTAPLRTTCAAMSG